MTAAMSVGGNTSIAGTLNSTANSSFRVEFFASTTGDPSGFGQGQQFLGSTTVSTDTSGNGSFSVTLPVTVNSVEVITATATDPAGNTSEFSADFSLSMCVMNTNDSGPGSLRQAILNANANPGLDTICFDIPGAGVQTITPLTPLPTITDPVVIDGTTQAGFAGTPLIELNGANLSTGSQGLVISAGNSTVKSLLIDHVPGDAIQLTGGGGNLIEGNSISSDATGLELDNGATATVSANTFTDNGVGMDVNDSVITLAAPENVITDGANSIAGLLLQGPTTQVMYKLPDVKFVAAGDMPSKVTIIPGKVINQSVGSTIFVDNPAGGGGNFITLANHALQEPKVLDASGASFDGIKGDNLTEAQRQQVEARITDFLDGPNDEFVGIVLLKTNYAFMNQGNLFIFAGHSDDTIVLYGSDPAAVTVAINGQTLANPNGGNSFNLSATGGRPLIFGVTGNDLIDILGALGADVYGGSGNNRIYGGAGNDVLRGGTGDSVIRAGSGNAIIIGSTGINDLIGGTGSDIIVGGDDGGMIYQNLMLSMMSWESHQGLGPLNGHVKAAHNLNRMIGSNGPTAYMGDMSQIDSSSNPPDTGKGDEVFPNVTPDDVINSGDNATGALLAASASLAATSNPLSQLRETYGFWTTGNYWWNYLGLHELWFKDRYNQWYILTPDGQISLWNGGDQLTTIANGQVGAQVWADPSLLLQAPVTLATPQVELSTLRQTYGFRFTGDYYHSYLGLNYKWLRDRNNQWWVLTPSGQLQQWKKDGNNFQPPTALLDPLVFDDPNNLLQAPVPNELSELRHDYGFHFTGSYAESYLGLNYKWFQDRQGQWYAITPDGQLQLWGGGASFTTLATIDTAVFDDPTQLFNADVTLTAPAQSQLQQLEQTYGYYTTGNFFQSYLGWNYKWFLSNQNQWYVLTSGGQLLQWLGGISFTPPLATVDPLAFDDPETFFFRV
jgi:parallel beta-helix repeat protein